jgi:hypothetical protein
MSHVDSVLFLVLDDVVFYFAGCSNGGWGCGSEWLQRWHNKTIADDQISQTQMTQPAIMVWIILRRTNPMVYGCLSSGDVKCPLNVCVKLTSERVIPNLLWQPGALADHLQVASQFLSIDFWRQSEQR